MRRYYSGDIEGKFWFGIQSSDDASFFGGQCSEPTYLECYFDENDKQDICEGITKCKVALGKYEGMLTDFFANHTSYNDKELSRYLHTTQKNLTKMLKWFARLELGEKILDCVKKNGECHFDAEL